MAQRQDSRLVAYGVAGGYLKTFEFRRSLAWAAAMMKRCLADKTATNAASNRAVCPVASRANVAGSGQGVEMVVLAGACNGQNHG